MMPTVLNGAAERTEEEEGEMSAKGKQCTCGKETMLRILQAAVQI